MRNIVLASFLLLLSACNGAKKTAAVKTPSVPFLWENANLYFLLTDRFNNGDKNNDVNFGRTEKTAVLRGFMGGDILGITQKIEDGYFEKLGTTAIWFTPVIEQIHSAVDEGTGVTYGFHGYWAKDWTRLDPNFGTEADLANMIETAHRHGIRVVLDVVINHTGPATAAEPAWPAQWVRESPQCTYKNYETTTACTLVKNLPDIRTESNASVDLPPALVQKWKTEGRYEQEVSSLDAFFKRTGYPRAPRFYIIKWLCDMVRKYGVDGFRCDTAKHIEESVWKGLRQEADRAFADWKKAHPDKVLDNNDFYMTGEVFGYNISSGRMFDFGDTKRDFYANGFSSLINFELKYDAENDYEAVFSKYSRILNSTLKGKTVLNYMTSHDDGSPFDVKRAKSFETGTKLLLCPGGAQVYYGDETARNLVIPGAQGDATLRSFMNWDELAAGGSRSGYKIQEVLSHWQKLGQFRKYHPAVGAGVHTMLTAQPYTFKRTYTGANGYSDAVVVGLDLPKGRKEISMEGVFANGTALKDYYSGQVLTVQNGKVLVNSEFDIALIGK
jgi:alpha-amylase